MPPPPNPHPRRQQKSPVRGQTIRKKYIFGDFYDCNEKRQKGTLPGVLKRSPHEKYSRRIPERVQTEEIQESRQARSRPADKETLNTMLREKMIKTKTLEVNQ